MPWTISGSRRIDPARMRGSSDAYESWNMYWMSRRSRRYSRPLDRARSLPPKRTAPLVGLSRPTSIRPIVVLPQPDSPTRPSVSPLRMSKDTPATALTVPTWRWSTPLVTGNSLTRSLAASTTPPTDCSSTSSSSTLTTGSTTVRWPATVFSLAPTGKKHRYVCAVVSPVRSGPSARHLSVAYRQRGANRQPLGRVDQVRRRAGDGVQPLPGLRRLLGQGVKERLGVGMTGVGVQGVGVGGLHHLARVHDRDPVRAPGDHAEVVRDHDHRHAEPPPQVVDQLEDLLLDCHVERGRGLVGDQQLRIARQGHRDHHALPHAAGELVRVLVDPFPRPRHAHQVENLDGPVERLLLADVPVQQHRLGDLVADGVGGVQRGQRVLEDHADIVAADPAHLFRLEVDELPPAQLDRAGEAAAVRQQLHDRQRGHRLAAAGLADHAERLALVDVQGHAVDGVHHTVPELNLRAQVGNF